MTDNQTPRTDAFNNSQMVIGCVHKTREETLACEFDNEDSVVSRPEYDTLESRLIASQKECEEQARLNGMGASREAALEARLAKAESLSDQLKLAAQVHAQESRTANATIAEIYQLVTGATGEPGDWNGAEPVRTYIAQAESKLAEATKQLKLSDELASAAVSSYHELQENLAEAEARTVEVLSDKNEAYRQRNYLVAALAKLFPSGIRKTDIPGWEDDWHGCCFIDLPSGQISYHFHDSHAHLFADLPAYETLWDGHDKETVHSRLLSIRASRPSAQRKRKEPTMTTEREELVKRLHRLSNSSTVKRIFPVVCAEIESIAAALTANPDARDAGRFRHLQDLPFVDAQAFFWNYESRKQRAKAIDAAIAKEKE